ncbi:MAG: DUF4886 domain-containing protein [Tyzzerella sp.]|nr:DUF4886 domain-containing protein [Tyzzerella sp.]
MRFKGKLIKSVLLPTLSLSMLLAPVSPVKAAPKEVKVLSIGHSYSVNSCEYLYEIAKSQGVEMTIGIAFRGNCPLRMHYEYLTNQVVYGEAMGGGYYQKYVPGGYSATYADEYTLEEMLTDEKWDYIIFQDCLDTAGDWNVVSEWLLKLYEKVQKIMREQQNTDVQYIYHEIWAMENIEYNPSAKEKVEFKKYNHDSDIMYKVVSETSKKAAENFEFRLLPTGDAFQIARSTSMFDASQGGKILVADSTNHANDYGKYLAGVTWFETITQMSVDRETVYYPDVLTEEEAYTLIDCATQAVNESGLQLTEVKAEQGQVVDVVEDEEEETKKSFLIPAIVGGAILVAVLVAIIAIIKHTKK